MCGIAGIVDPDLGAEEILGRLRAMTDTMVHRGPDDEGFFEADGVGLGMRRLSIIDVAGGQQPLTNEDRQIRVVCNGEIYNHRELRAGLEARGHRFRTRSDVEVVAHLYEEKGLGCLNDLYGMFGLAIWDGRERRMVVARDRLGKKPLFYHAGGDRFLFASEIKALLASSPELLEENPEALVPYLRFGFVPQPDTMFREIRKLPAGSFGVWERGRLRIEPYWELDFPEAGSQPPGRYRDWVEELDALLEDAVRSRLESEVPLGVFLSGGLDSSTVVAYANRVGLRPLRTFTVGFDAQDWDESPDARIVAERFGTDHHVLRLTEGDLLADLPGTLLKIVRQCDEPFGDPAALPTLHISRLAREHVTVILSGDGGDELFAGYTMFKGAKFAQAYRRLPEWLGSRVLPHAVSRLAAHGPSRYRDRLNRVARVLESSLQAPELAYFTKGTKGGDRALAQVLEPGHVPPSPTPDRLPFPPEVNRILRSEAPLLSRLSHTHIVFHLVDRYLVKVDRMSMAHSLEVRCPLLDHRVVEFAATLPPDAKLRGWESKAILRDTVRPLLPRGTLRKRKQGFDVPLRKWLRTELNEMVGDYLLAEPGGLPPEVFDPAGVRRMIGAHRRAEADHSSMIWLLLSYAAWRDLYRDVRFRPVGATGGDGYRGGAQGA